MRKYSNLLKEIALKCNNSKIKLEINLCNFILKYLILNRFRKRFKILFCNTFKYI